MWESHYERIPDKGREAGIQSGLLSGILLELSTLYRTGHRSQRGLGVLYEMKEKKSKIKSGHSRGDMLTNRQEKFVQELVKGKSQREAYKIAYPASLKWKENTVDSRASVLMRNKKVSKRYEELKKKIESRTVYDAAEVRQTILDTLMAILKADVADDLVDGRAVKNKRWDSKNRTIYEHYDKLEAAKMLREMLGIDPVDTGNGITIKIENGGDYEN